MYIFVFLKTGDIDYISGWKSKGLSGKIIKPPNIFDNSLAPALSYTDHKTRLNFGGSCLKQDKITFTHGKIVNICIVYEISVSDSKNNYFTLKIVLFGAVKLTENADIDKYKYSGYVIGFDRRGTFWFPSAGFGNNVIIFAVNMSSSVHVDNKKDILIFGEGHTQVLDDTILAAEKKVFNKRNFSLEKYSL